MERIAKNLIENESPADPENLNQKRYVQKGGFERITGRSSTAASAMC